jgi:hypothetical protein
MGNWFLSNHRSRWAGNGFLFSHQSWWTGTGFLLSHHSQRHSLFLVWCDRRSKASQLEVGEQNADERERCAKGPEDDGDDFVFHRFPVDGMGRDESWLVNDCLFDRSVTGKNDGLWVKTARVENGAERISSHVLVHGGTTEEP